MKNRVSTAFQGNERAFHVPKIAEFDLEKGFQRAGG
jgi:hypothetical protein